MTKAQACEIFAKRKTDADLNRREFRLKIAYYSGKYNVKAEVPPRGISEADLFTSRKRQPFCVKFAVYLKNAF